FSIRYAGVYYVSDRNYWVGAPFNNAYVNHAPYIKQIANNPTNAASVVTPSYMRFLNSTEGMAAIRSYNPANSRVIPINVRASGASVATVAEFDGRGGYRTLPASSDAYFTAGNSVAAPASGNAPVAGPIAAFPTISTLTPTRMLVLAARQSTAVLNRSVVAAPL